MHSDLLVERIRGDVPETRHRGIIAVVDCAGHPVAGVGDTGATSFLRSSAKPLQAIPLMTLRVAERFALTDREVAVAIGSHSGQSFHTAVVGGLLEKLNLPVSALKCGLHRPYDPETARRLTGPPTPLHNNCSGKHAGMLALALHLGADPAHYDAPDHPVQRAILEAVETFSGLAGPPLSCGQDGCGVPTFAMPIRNMALAFARLVHPEGWDAGPGVQEAARRVTAAMVCRPEMIGGTHGRLDTDLMQAAEGRLIAKVGAEGVQCVGVFPSSRYPRGLGIALKIEDGESGKIRDVIVLESLRQLGLLDRGHLERLDAYAAREVTNHRGDVVGKIRCTFELKTS